ncbi:hypothetical protein Taro_032904 [Colocasia esculenta]|uniref:Uncharacterized protein n=1 Tax=Colocasia esculenta TaxID=4460 RepID=A0A843VMH2_COLES|nr:hypothetical protein [Colocasia esculenta]
MKDYDAILGLDWLEEHYALVIEKQKADPRLQELVGKAGIALDEDGVIRFHHQERVLELAGVVWRSSWWLGSRRSSTPSRSFSPLCLLRPAQTIILKSTKGPLVSTLPELVSTHCPKTAQKVFWKGL